MGRLNPEKLTVEFTEDTTASDPVIPRRYTLTHSDLTAELFLVIGNNYSYDKISSMRDEVLGEWVYVNERYVYHAYLFVDGNHGIERAALRELIFRRELPLALEAIWYGDRIFFDTHKELNTSPIIVFFQSTYPQYNKVENWGTFSDYIL